MSSLNKSVRSLTPPHLILILNPKAVDPSPTKSPDQSSEVKKNETLFATHLRRRNKQIPLDLHPFPSFFLQNLFWPFLITTLHHIAAVRSNTNHQPPISNDACVVTIGSRVSMNSTRTAGTCMRWTKRKNGSNSFTRLYSNINARLSRTKTRDNNVNTGNGCPLWQRKSTGTAGQPPDFQKFFGNAYCRLDACGDALGLTVDDQWSGVMASLWAPAGVSKSSS